MLAVSTCCLREVDVDRHGRLAAARRPRREAPWRAAYLVLREARFWRFLLFVVLLVGVRFIFRHLDATFPKYMVRQFDRRTPFGTYLALNPLLVIVLLPFISAFTPRVSAFRMILGGSLISAVSAFALAASPTPRGAIAFVALLSIGEAVWSPRLYEYSTMIAPKGREGTYMALASAPNFAARLTVGGLLGRPPYRVLPRRDPLRRPAPLADDRVNDDLVAHPHAAAPTRDRPRRGPRR